MGCRRQTANPDADPNSSYSKIATNTESESKLSYAARTASYDRKKESRGDGGRDSGTASVDARTRKKK